VFSFGAVFLTHHSANTLEGTGAESRGVAHEAIKLSYLLPAPGFRIKCGMTIAGPRHDKKNASLFMSLIIRRYAEVVLTIYQVIVNLFYSKRFFSLYQTVHHLTCPNHFNFHKT